MTIPSPSVLHFRGGRAGHQQGRLSRPRRVLRRPGQPTGTRSRRSTTPAAATCSSTTRSGPISARPEQAQARAARRRSRPASPAIYADLINTAIERPARRHGVTTHVCRGNFRSTWISEGGYEPVAELLLGEVELRRLLPRIRQRPRRRLRAAALPAEGQQAVVLGLVTSKSGDAGEEGRHQAPHRRGDASSSPLDQLCLSARSAVSPRPRRATCSPRTSSGPRCAMIVEISKRSGRASGLDGQEPRTTHLRKTV